MAGCCNHKLSLKKRPRRPKQLLIACGPYHWEAVGGERHLQYDPHSWHHQKKVHHNAVSSKPDGSMVEKPHPWVSLQCMIALTTEADNDSEKGRTSGFGVLPLAAPKRSDA